VNDPTPARVLAALSLLAGASLLLVTAGLAIPMAAYLIATGIMPATAADVRTAQALLPAVPILVGVAALQAATGVGLLMGRRWALPLAVGLAAAWSAMWTLALVATLAGWAPFDPSVRPAPAAATWSGVTLSSVGIVGSLVVAGSLVVDGILARRKQRFEAAVG
jgi:hypothetical protein